MMETVKKYALVEDEEEEEDPNMGKSSIRKDKNKHKKNNGSRGPS